MKPDRTGDICDFIQSYSEEYSYPPTLTEIGEEFGRQATWAFHQLNRLEDAGLIHRNRRHPRTVVVL